MRENKFRAWDKECKKMLDVDTEKVLLFLDGQILISDDYCGACDQYKYNIDEDSTIELMQYTGLIDIKEKEIYEGDIVKVFRKDSFKSYVSEVYFSNCCFGTAWYNPIKKRLEFVPLDNWFVEVIGNIYENQELV